MRFLSRRVLVVALVCAALIGWGMYTRHWIQQRHEIFEWAADDPLSNPSKGIRGIGIAGLDRLPFSLRIWGESRALDFISVDLSHVPDDDIPRVQGLKRLFPEAMVEIYRSDVRGQVF